MSEIQTNIDILKGQVFDLEEKLKKAGNLLEIERDQVSLYQRRNADLNDTLKQTVDAHHVCIQERDELKKKLDSMAAEPVSRADHAQFHERIIGLEAQLCSMEQQRIRADERGNKLLDENAELQKKLSGMECANKKLDSMVEHLRWELKQYNPTFDKMGRLATAVASDFGVSSAADYTHTATIIAVFENLRTWHVEYRAQKAADADARQKKDAIIDELKRLNESHKDTIIKLEKHRTEVHHRVSRLESTVRGLYSNAGYSNPPGVDNIMDRMQLIENMVKSLCTLDVGAYSIKQRVNTLEIELKEEREQRKLLEMYLNANAEKIKEESAKLNICIERGLTASQTISCTIERLSLEIRSLRNSVTIENVEKLNKQMSEMVLAREHTSNMVRSLVGNTKRMLENRGLVPVATNGTIDENIHAIEQAVSTVGDECVRLFRLAQSRYEQVVDLSGKLDDAKRVIPKTALQDIMRNIDAANANLRDARMAAAQQLPN